MDRTDIIIGEIIYDKRRAMHLTQTELGEKVGITTQCVHHYEKGKRSIPISVFFRICDVLGLDPNDIQNKL